MQTPEETSAAASARAATRAWLLVQVLRNLGLAARFVSGYLVQLTADDRRSTAQPGRRPTSPTSTPGPRCTSPAPAGSASTRRPACSPARATSRSRARRDPRRAAPVTGADRRRCEVDVRVRQRRHPRPRGPARHPALHRRAVGARSTRSARAVDDALRAGDVRLTMGGEPTFVSVDDMDGASGTSRPTAPTSATLAARRSPAACAAALRARRAAPPRPGQVVPGRAPAALADRRALAHRRRAAVARPGAARRPAAPRHARRRRGRARSPTALADGARPRPPTAPARATRTRSPPCWREAAPARRRAARVDVDADDPASTPTPAGLAPSTPTRLTRVGWVLPAAPRGDDERLGDRPRGACAAAGWSSSPATRRWAAPAARLARLEPPSAATRARPLARFEPLRAHLAGPAPATALRRPRAVAPVEDVAADRARASSCATARLHVFLPPLDAPRRRRSSCSSASSSAARRAGHAGRRSRATRRPRDPRICVARRHARPRRDRGQRPPDRVVGGARRASPTTLYDDGPRRPASAPRSSSSTAPTPAPAAATTSRSAARTAADSPLLRRPDLLRSLVTFWQHHPSLSYLFSGRFVGPTSQAPRVDEGRARDPLRARDRVRRARPAGGRGTPRRRGWSTALLRHLLVDITGNTHRAEFCIDKLFSPDTRARPARPASSCARSRCRRTRGWRWCRRCSCARSSARFWDEPVPRAARALGHRAARPLPAAHWTSPPTSPTWSTTCAAHGFAVRAPRGSTRSSSSASRGSARSTIAGVDASSCATRSSRGTCSARRSAPRHRALRRLVGRAPPGRRSTGSPTAATSSPATAAPCRCSPTGDAGRRTSPACATGRGSRPRRCTRRSASTAARVRRGRPLERRSLGGCTYHVVAPGGRAYETLPGERQRGRGPPREPLRGARPHARPGRDPAWAADGLGDYPRTLDLRRA